MPKYYVSILVQDEYGYEVEADSAEEAEDKARDVWENEGSQELEFLATFELEFNAQELEKDDGIYKLDIKPRYQT